MTWFTQNLEPFDIKSFTMSTIFWHIVVTILKEIYVVKQLNDAKLWVKNSQFFIIPKIIVVWHV